MNEEIAWLIELTGDNTPTWWSRIDGEDGVCGWSSDSLKAIRFSRAEDAQAIIDDIGWTRAIPTEHAWCNPTPPSEIAGDGK